MEGIKAAVFVHFSMGDHRLRIGLVGGFLWPILPERLLRARRFILMTRYSRRSKTMRGKKSESRLAILPYTCVHRTSGGRGEQVHLGALSLPPVEPRLRALTRGIYARTGSPDSLTRSWALFLMSLGWETRLARLLGMRDRTFPLAAT